MVGRRSSVVVLSCSLVCACADDSGSGGDGGSGPDSSADTGTGSDSEAGSDDGIGAEVGETETDGSETTDDPTAETGETGEVPPDPICATALPDSITGEAIAAHLLAFDAIAAEHDGNRSAGTSGYEASAVYVETQLQAAGYTTTRWPFTFDRYVQFGPPQLAVATDPPLLYIEQTDYAIPNWSPAGSVSAAIEPVDLALGLGNLSSSGCEPEDFAGFTPGHVALLQRGGCTFVTKAGNAEAAGAVATVIFNQGDSEAKLGLFGGSLGNLNTLDNPVVFATYAVGVALADAAALDLTIVELSVDAGVVETETFNVLAETATGDPEHVVMLGAHLDSVPAGPGVNDNGSGSATVLELARQFATCAPNHKVRFAWWGAEEWGLIGSRQWVEALPDEELARLALYLNFDMVASPNYVRFVHHGMNGPEGSTALHDLFVEWFDAQQLPVTGSPFEGNSDYQGFVDAGVPASGLATGAGAAKTQAQADTYGGIVGEAYDACYHQACDDQLNFALDVLGQNGQATAYVLEQLATDLGELAPTPDIVHTSPSEITQAAAHECGSVHE